MEIPDVKTPHPSPTTSDFQMMWNIVPELSRILTAHQMSSESFTSTNSATDQAKKCPKKEFKKFTWGQDLYEGTVVGDNLHGPGFYHTQRNGKKFFYDGLFYMNRLEGYCQVFYENGTHFQGLFKEHLRYGPGVLSYPNDTQDIGFWNGMHLIRLACPVGYDIVPAIANSQLGKTKLLSNRFMVPLCDENNDLVQQALKDLGTDEEAMEIMDEVYNLNIRNPRSLFFHKKFYDQQFFGGNDCTIKVLVDKKTPTDDEQPNEIDNTDRIAERCERLRNKILEVNEGLKSFTAIKIDLSERVDKCKKCCVDEEDYEDEDGDNTARVIEFTGHVSSSVTTPEVSSSGLLFDASLASMVVVDSQKSLKKTDSVEPTAKDDSLLIDLCKCDEDEAQEVDLQSLEEQLRNIIVQERYARNICDELQKKLDRILETESNQDKNVKYKLVKVTELWAWNNEDSLVQIQKHCFKHRNSEDMVNFSVPSLILGNRREFGPMGSHEELCSKFLLACSKGNKTFVKDCVRKNKVHPNLADIRGNTGMFFASAKNQHEIIPILTNFGAKLDQVNDEQLTPLALTFLQYISIKYNCKDWEKGFLPESKIRKTSDLPKWYDVKSFSSFISMGSITSINSEPPNAISNMRIADLVGRASVVANMQTSIIKSNVKYVFDMQCSNRAPRTDTEDAFFLEVKLKSTSLTIVTLLTYGASPNACETPFPILALSLFTENSELVREVIAAKADVSILLTNEQLSCLHIAASLNPSDENAKMCAILVKAGCNANHKTLPSHWPDRRSYYTGTLPENFEIEDHGKNALHLLCMRTDFEGDESTYFCSVANAFIESDLNLTDTYLGHTPLSLAVLSGNIKLVQYFVKNNAFDPYEFLDYGMGNILTLFALKRFENTLTIDQCKAMLTALFDLNVNVLNRVDYIENAIVFAEEEDNFFERFVSNDTKKNEKEKGKPKPKKVEKHSKIAAIKEFMQGLGRQYIIKQIQIRVTEMLYTLLEEDELESCEIAAILTYEYLTPKDAYENLLNLFRTRKIDHERLDHIKIKNLLDFVDLNKRVVKKAVGKSPKKEKVKKAKVEEPEADIETIETMIENFDDKLHSDGERVDLFTLPGLDDPQKYEICFHCLRGKNKELKSCPRCQMVSFCSSECNKLNIKLKSEHHCNIQFYHMTDEEMMEISNGVCLTELEESVKERCFARLQSIRKAKHILEEEKLLEMWRADTYGTKFLQLKPLIDKAMRKTTGKQPNWSLGLLQKLLERTFQSFSGDLSLYSVENLLLKLQAKRLSEGIIRTKQTPSSARNTLGGGSTLHSSIFEEYCLPEETDPKCKCKKKVHHKIKTKAEPSTNKKPEADKTFPQHLTPQMTDEQFKATLDEIPVQKKTAPLIKLKKIPDQYQKFIEVVGTYFPEVDFSTWLLPYTCYSDGQLYYKFCTNDNDLFKESYSLT